MAEIGEVHFPIHTDPQYVVVERLHEDQLNSSAAYNALRLVVSAYKAQFEGPGTVANLPPGTIEGHFRPEDKAGVQRQLSRMHDYMQTGSSYWFAVVKGEDPGRGGVNQSESAGMIKVSPSRATLSQRLRFVSPNLFLNDIVVSHEMQNRSIGTDMLYTVVMWSGYHGNSSLALDGFVGSSVNDWFTGLGLSENPSADVQPLDLGDYKLEEIRFESGSLTLDAIADAMRERYPHLADAAPAGRCSP